MVMVVIMMELAVLFSMNQTGRKRRRAPPSTIGGGITRTSEESVNKE